MHQLETISSDFPVAKLPSSDHGPNAVCATEDKVHGLMRVLFICKGAKVMLTCNLNDPYDLLNGSIGTIFDIIYCKGTKPPLCQPGVAMVHFPRYTGPPFMKDNPCIVSLVPAERKVD
ncbi:hypothetical protein DPMN_159029 [Dreissena polymorpha]|uniref:Uncharacterized protein n=1 Tax=Dreissena polymorpha TaxID=45954 RepID=A0A9D4IRE7_DREPO|nr:hypothetical protein DPMN_159029 [Dreissena polymorpha]